MFNFGQISILVMISISKTELVEILIKPQMLVGNMQSENDLDQSFHSHPLNFLIISLLTQAGG